VLLEFRLDAAGVREILRGDEVRQLIDGKAEEIAEHIKAAQPDAPVEVRRYTTDRGAATVAVTDVQAMAWQARDGLLTRAAGAAGLEVKAWQR
jgi:alkylated DNA repair dioxygenase AlkB